MFRRAVGSLLARRFSPCATHRTAPARSLHSLRDLPIGGGAAGVAAAAFAAGVGVTLAAVHYFRNDEPAARKEEDMSKEEELKARFEDWMNEHDRTYRDEEEKAMRFEVFKANVKRIESLPPSWQKMLHPGYFGDMKDEERPSGRY